MGPIDRVLGDESPMIAASNAMEPTPGILSSSIPQRRNSALIRSTYQVGNAIPFIAFFNSCGRQ